MRVLERGNPGRLITSSQIPICFNVIKINMWKLCRCGVSSWKYIELFVLYSFETLPNANTNANAGSHLYS